MNDQLRSPKILLHSAGLGGHRAAFVEFSSALLDGERVSTWKVLFDSRAALFLMIEDGFGRFIAISLWRSLFGRKTVGLLFRPLPALSGASLRLKVKNWFLKRLRGLKFPRVLTIIPFSLEPRIASIASGWIYDFQLWDMGRQERELFACLQGGAAVEGAGDIYAKIKENADQRKVLVALGAQTEGKGFSVLAELSEASGMEGWLIVVLGKVAPEQASAKARLQAGAHLVEDRFVDDAELVAAYAAADAVWCLYDKSYDQASGILGRALQFGVPPIVRKGSLSEKLCLVESVPHISAIDAANCVAALQSIPKTDPKQGNALADKFREVSVSTLSDQLSAVAKRK
ncbi:MULTISPECIES: hypothetical protein [unclassified Sulfitobacter]|uniref:hypothetical protein n=1 Tax=unclassified Sulfitobacter TaxID=196795 RepID=UPI00374536B5